MTDILYNETQRNDVIGYVDMLNDELEFIGKKTLFRRKPSPRKTMETPCPECGEEQGTNDDCSLCNGYNRRAKEIREKLPDNLLPDG